MAWLNLGWYRTRFYQTAANLCINNWPQRFKSLCFAFLTTYQNSSKGNFFKQFWCGLLENDQQCE